MTAAIDGGPARPALSDPRLPRSATGVIAVAAPVLTLAICMAFGVRGAELMLGLAFAAVAVAAAARRPAAALVVVVVYVPVQVPLLAWLFRLGVPEGIVRNLGFVKEAMAAGIVLAALGKVRTWKPADLLDLFAAVYVGIATAYLLIPVLSPGTLGGNDFTIRLNAWRLDCLFVIVFLAARRLSFSRRDIDRLRNVAVVVAILMAGVAVWEAVAASSYNHFFVTTIGVPVYQSAVLHTPDVNSSSVVAVGALGGHSFDRIGSLLFDPLSFAFWSLIPLGLCLERLSLDRARAWWIAGGIASASAVVLTITRSAVLGGLLAVVLSVTVGASEVRVKGRSRLLVALVLLALVLAPFAAVSTLRSRVTSVVSTTSNADNTEHLTASRSALDKVIAHPAGLGLGANPASGFRYGTANLTVTEDAYLQVGTELGVVPMVAFTLLLLGLVVKLRRRSASLDGRSGLAGGVWLAGVALFVGGFFLQVWTSFPVSLTFWGLAGVALGERAVVRAAIS